MATFDVSFVIVSSSRSYWDALRVAHEASGKLAIRLDLRDLHLTKDDGFTHSRTGCSDDGVWTDYPCYRPRGRWDAGEYVSIEKSDAFRGFEPGYYIVVAASGREDTDEFPKGALARAREHFKDAYVKKAPTYFGCEH